ncbi:MAG: hypothetical protein JJU02_01555 [Cryomorphaceae bacterium]|nr:hypothetical protein [Cryomorphaceae bacterium]
MISFKIDAEGIFETEQVRIRKSTDKEDFGRKGLFRADSWFYSFLRNLNARVQRSITSMLL